VQDVDRLKEFYIDILNFKLIEETKSEWALLKAGICTIGLHKAGDQYQYYSAEDAGINSNAKIVFETEDDIKEIRKELLNKKIKMREIKSFDNYDCILCDGEDPEGNVFQLKQKKSN